VIVITVRWLPLLDTRDTDSGSLRRTLMIAKSKSLEPRSRKPDLSTDIEERIRQRAFELHEQRGRVDGFALDDWLQAETEILGAQKHRKVKAAKGSK
jgi:Protein of unknown function (DUF2934)